MPFTIHVDPDRRLGLARLHGRVSGQELLAANEALYAHRAWQPGFDEFWDCRPIEEMVVDLEQMHAVVEMESEAESLAGNGRVVLAITREVVEMMGELYQAMMEGAGRDVIVVRTLQEGAAALGLGGVPLWFAQAGERPEAG